jgi:predicted Zn-dependent protease
MIKGSVPVKALLRQADAQRAAGDLVSAAATLERGVRIEPRNPYLWNRLARIRLEQGQFSQAESLAAKSNLLAGDLPALLGDNRRIIGEARRK